MLIVGTKAHAIYPSELRGCLRVKSIESALGQANLQNNCSDSMVEISEDLFSYLSERSHEGNFLLASEELKEILLEFQKAQQRNLE